jgi:adenine-specific DNA-methyltransferase
MLNDYSDFIINDFLYSSEVIYNAFFGSKYYSDSKISKYYTKYKNLDSKNLDENYVSINFGGKYFSVNDAKKIGYIREDLELSKGVLNTREFDILLSSLIYSFDRCANTVGHYDAYIKGKNVKDSFLFELIKPVTENTENKKIKIFREDANKLALTIKSDVTYIDPPYSSRQYSRFYHVIENIVKWEKPILYGEALKYDAENMSEYCKSKAIDNFQELIYSLKSKYIVVSYNNTYNSKSRSSENKMKLEDIKKVLDKKGETTVYMTEHQAFNAGKTELKDHMEILFITKVNHG